MVVKTWHASRPLSAATAEHSHAVLASLVASFVIFCHILTYVVSLFSPPYDLMCLPYPWVLVLQPSRLSSTNMSFRYLFCLSLCWFHVIPCYAIVIYSHLNLVHIISFTSFKVHRHGWSAWSISRSPQVWKLKRSQAPQTLCLKTNTKR